MTEEKEAVAKALQSLGDSSEKVGRTLWNLAYRGVPCDGYQCPVARYIKGVTGIQVHVTTQSVMKFVDNDEYPTWELSLPKAVAEFIREFDDELWFGLIDEEMAGE